MLSNVMIIFTFYFLQLYIYLFLFKTFFSAVFLKIKWESNKNNTVPIQSHDTLSSWCVSGEANNVQLTVVLIYTNQIKNYFWVHMMILIKELKQVLLSDVGPLHFALGDEQPASPSWLSFWSHECIFHIQRLCLVMSNEGAWYTTHTTLGFSEEQKHTLMLENCLIVNYRNVKSRQTNTFC